MNVLLSIFLALGACAGLTVWQQQALGRINARIAELSAHIVKTRAAAEDDDSTLAALRKQLRNWQARESALGSDQTGRDSSAALGPEKEGWWPANQPYFYLDKKLLPYVRLRDHEMSPAEVRALGKEFQQGTDYEIQNRLLSDGKLNEHLVAVMGMTDSEKTSIEQVYAELERQFRALEVARIQSVNPPESLGDAGQVIARIPSMTKDMEPLQAQVHESLEQILGPKRTELFEVQATTFFNQYEDGLGSVNRDFIMRQGMLCVRYANSHGAPDLWFYSGRTYGAIPFRSDAWEYRHLFGPGGPCEIKKL